MEDGGRPVSWKMDLIRFYYRIQKIVRDFFNFFNALSLGVSLAILELSM